MKTVTVDAQALRDVLSALTGPGHIIREMLATRSLPPGIAMPNPINILIEDFNKAWNERQSGAPQVPDLAPETLPGQVEPSH
ncbi:MAG: hypothetical protein Q7U48_13590 [Hydrogenophaga sp.]|nr:hypothetical protein [Hydrogenophaga sp.]